MAKNPTDHDLLIEHSVLLREIKTEIQEMRDGNAAKLVDHESRIRKIEDLILSINLLERIKKGDELLGWLVDFRTRWKVYATIFGLVIGVVTSILTTLIIKQL